MAGKAGLKAGLIGAVVMVIISILNNLVLADVTNTTLTIVMCGVSTLLYAGIGVLAGFFLAPPRTTSRGAGAAAIAGLISGIISSAVGITLILTGVSKALDPQQMEQLAELGMNPTLFAIPGAVCGLGIGVGAAAIGGAILAAIKPD